MGGLIDRRRLLELAALAPLGAAFGCNGTFPTVFGYKLGAGALYDPNIKTVYVPLFQNRAFQTTPYRNFEKDITQAVINEIGKTTAFRVTSDYNKADTQLSGVVMTISKQLYNQTQQNLVREGELVVNVDVVWRDLRDGTILSMQKRGRKPGGPGGTEPPVPFDPTVEQPPPKADVATATPTRITAFGRYLPELGESNASAMQRVQNRLAVQIVSMMEAPWGGG